MSNPIPVAETVPTRYWHALADGRVQCDVCPRACKLHEGQRGLCFVRAREHDAVVPPANAALLAEKIPDARVEILPNAGHFCPFETPVVANAAIRRFLQAGIMEGGIVSPRVEGTPQGSPLSPLLSNILLDEWDKELEQRGHRFVRYADAVSYTHLRAHETVLDLVCRLLLEKKKPSHNTSPNTITL